MARQPLPVSILVLLDDPHQENPLSRQIEDPKKFQSLFFWMIPIKKLMREHLQPYLDGFQSLFFWMIPIKREPAVSAVFGSGVSILVLLDDPHQAGTLALGR